MFAGHSAPSYETEIFEYIEVLAFWFSPFCARNAETPGQRADLFSARYRFHRPLL